MSEDRTGNSLPIRELSPSFDEALGQTGWYPLNQFIHRPDAFFVKAFDFSWIGIERDPTS